MKESLTKLGSAGAAFLASLCCIGPLVLAGLGVGGAGLATGLAEYRPLLMGITAVLLGAAFYYTYRKREVACGDGSCRTSRGSRNSKLSLWGITTFVILLFSIPYLNWNQMNAKEPLANANLTTVSLQVNGMTCSGCESIIEVAVGRLNGVSSVDVNYSSKEAVISYDPEQTTEHNAIKTIEESGFAVTLKN